MERNENLNPIDDLMFKVMSDEDDFCIEIVRTVIGEKELIIVEPKQQFSIANLKGRSVILDLFCKKEDGTLLNVEVQKTDDEDHQRRARFNAALLTARYTAKGTEFEKIPDTVIIFITKNDFFEQGKTVYYVDRVLRGIGKVVYNGLTEIYINASVNDGSDIAELMQIFCKDDEYNFEKFPITSNLKYFLKNTEKGRAIMGKASQEIFDEGFRKGKMDSYIELYNEGTLTLKSAAEHSGLSEEEFLKLVEEKSKNN